ncbi:MAG: hypothetical protein M3R04_02285, partial [bacterium]|nr:hypothetical protein [bacterium]
MWLIGANYYNYENDTLRSNVFTILDNTDGIRVTFKARWKIASGDACGVYWWVDGAPDTLVTVYENGQNPDYPATRSITTSCRPTSRGSIPPTTSSS